MSFRKTPHILIFLTALFLWLGIPAYAGSATDIAGLYYTGVDSSGHLLSDGSNTASIWTVPYARVNGVDYTGKTIYTGASYVLSASYIDPAYVPNSSTSKWITAPGASTLATGGVVNVGGDYLPGNGTNGINSAQFVYQLAFNIVGTGSGTVTNQVSISLTMAADDQYSVYINPTLNANGSVNTASTLAGSATNAWNNTSAITIQNFGAGNNATFKIGLNYLYVVVDNTNNVTGFSGSNALNPSGLLVYQVGAVATIDGHPVPEVGTWLPVVGALGLFGWRRFRRLSEFAV